MADDGLFMYLGKEHGIWDFVQEHLETIVVGLAKVLQMDAETLVLPLQPLYF